jgi:hypothetical protein
MVDATTRVPSQMRNLWLNFIFAAVLLAMGEGMSYNSPRFARQGVRRQITRVVVGRGVPPSRGKKVGRAVLGEPWRLGETPRPTL